MKKKFFISAGVVCMAMMLAFNVNLNIKKSNMSSILTFSNLEALAADDENKPDEENIAKGCETVPGANTGKCLRGPLEANYSCETAEWYQSKNCR